MYEDTIYMIMLEQITELRRYQKDLVEGEDDYMIDKFQQVIETLYKIELQNRKIVQNLKYAIEGLVEARETEGYDTNNEQYYIECAINLIN